MFFEPWLKVILVVLVLLVVLVRLVVLVVLVILVVLVVLVVLLLVPLVLELFLVVALVLVYKRNGLSPSGTELANRKYLVYYLVLNLVLIRHSQQNLDHATRALLAIAVGPW